jgi:hypothetical protein
MPEKRAKTGGRKAGTLNKATASRSAAAPSPSILPLASAREASGPAFPAYKLVRVDSLVPYPANARTHSPASIDLLCRLITENGWTNPILVAGNDILAGHARRLAAIKLKLAVVPVIDLSHLSKVQRRAYILADNASALNASWDDDLLRIELTDLKDAGFDLSLTGFDGVAVDVLFGEGGSTGNLADDFGIAPFSVLNAREGWWQDRKRAWLALGIASELGRGGDGAATPPHVPNVTKNPDGTLNYSGTPGTAQRFEKQGRRPNAIPGGAPMPLDRAKDRANATPGGAMLPAADYSKRKRGDGRGRAIA